MKKHLLALVLLSSGAYSHGDHHHSHGTADEAATGFSVLWNGYEILNHGAALLGLGHTNCCGHSTKAFHALELIGHGSNLFEGVSHFMEENTHRIAVPVVSLAFNLWAAHAQYQTLQARGFSTLLGMMLAPLAAMDLYGHTTSAYVAVRELAGI